MYIYRIPSILKIGDSFLKNLDFLNPVADLQEDI